MKSRTEIILIDYWAALSAALLGKTFRTQFAESCKARSYVRMSNEKWKILARASQGVPTIHFSPTSSALRDLTINSSAKRGVKSDAEWRMNVIFLSDRRRGFEQRGEERESREDWLKSWFKEILPENLL